MTPKRRGFGCKSAVIDPDASGRRVADVCGLGSNCVCHRAVCPPSSRPGRAAQHGNGILQRQSGKRRSPWGRTGCHPKGWETSRERRRRGLAGRGCEHGGCNPGAGEAGRTLPEPRWGGLGHLDSGIWPRSRERMSFCCFGPRRWRLLQQPQDLMPGHGG